MSIPPEFVSIIVPVLDEEIHLPDCLDALERQLPQQGGEILVVDGGSTDRSVEIVRERMLANPAIRLIHNPDRIQSAGFNLAARAAHPDSTILVRADAHAAYPDGFVASCIAALRRHRATSVVVPMRTEGRAGFQLAVAAAQNSLIGNGGSGHRRAARSGPVEHGHHAAFDRAFFTAIGGYDRSFTHNEDAEHDVRAHRAGGRVWMCAEATMTYFPRSRPLALARQYARHGSGRCRTLLLNRLRPRPRQMIPVGVVAMLGVTPPLAALLDAPALLALPVSYLLLCVAWGIPGAIARRQPWLLATGAAAIVIHVAWGTGFVARLIAATFRIRNMLNLPAHDAAST